MPTDSQKSAPWVADEQLQRLRELSFLEQIWPAVVQSESALHESVPAAETAATEVVSVVNLVTA